MVTHTNLSKFDKIVYLFGNTGQYVVSSNPHEANQICPFPSSCMGKDIFLLIKYVFDSKDNTAVAPLCWSLY